MKKENTITINVIGTPGSGKSRLTYLLKTYLNQIGFNIDFDAGIDFKDESDFDKIANKDFSQTLQRMKETVTVSLNQSQIDRNASMKTIAQQLNVEEFPFEIRDKNGKLLYHETSDGFWAKWEYDSNGNLIYMEHCDKFWNKWEYDSNGKQTYFEDSNGYIEDNRTKPCEGKVVEVDGIKYKLVKA